MNSLFRSALVAAAAASLLSGCVIVIGDDDDYDDGLVYSGDYDDRPAFVESSYDGGYPSENVLTDVRTRFNEDTYLREEPILISASDGIVTLSGEVDSARTIERAVEVASQTAGVESVVLKVVLTVE